MRKSISLILALTLIAGLFNINIQGNAQSIINTDLCRSYISIDYETGDVLYSYNADIRIYPASTTKLMTALVAIENCSLDKIFTTSENATRFLEEGSGELELKTGETMDFYSLLHGLLIRSFNDVALVIAENVAGSEDNFINMMNEKAVLLGATNTHFVTPHGLHDDEHYTTARDLALIAKAAFSNFTISTICRKKEYKLPATNLRNSFEILKNTNLILGTNTGYDFIVTGGKTGFTSKAQNVLVALSSDQQGREVLTVIAGTKERDVAADLTLELMKYSYIDFAVQPIVKAGQIIGSNEGINLANAMYIEHLVPFDTHSWQLDKTIYLRDGIIYTQVEIGDILGYVTYSYNGNYIGKSLIVAASSLIPQNTIVQITSENQLEYIKTDGIIENRPFSLEFVIALSVSVLLLVAIILINNKTKKHLKIQKEQEDSIKSDSKDNIEE
ncbi:MAG TPA: D-alanyl-D-alanine carboxypeptidase family protein [Clostridia bacterium]|nr:MAG: D-alanyl-D-alanine carboxypeptidase DacB precursor [Firmicutes bacterium ADurb.Bin146]HOD93330.1 D-alanyl-D-alanine carboxypeptidase family protein [Clostridia bacterium]HQM39586.1 D-alanyl-D-alanine carboxypeptidase family protein [Clostridia bacterium]